MTVKAVSADRAAADNAASRNGRTEPSFSQSRDSRRAFERHMAGVRPGPPTGYAPEVTPIAWLTA
ncbi:hypothetical protein XAP412_1010017 [Xanthomonas phaseoli pv. phaseoli]|uniref:Uncharacterized protein n=1 Tax=Xanthomonas campestris pv. phaseoli TaxID=317013 RepID=A0AB38DUT3_XANCH|nr:hypothetical protein XAP412_1010017 [Xanthomonas phaseoli pv. phaseoli]SON77234.1 hypothetical protein XAP7430_1030016 [Xanthomonas phaseoli pv. phaseoli]